MANISLTASMRSNLLSLQNTQSLMDTTQNRLSSGLKVNSAIDNPSSYYTAQSLNNRASDLSALMDSMGQGIQTLKAADEAIKSITKFAEQAKAVANSARDVPNNMKENVTSVGKVGLNDTITKAGNILIDGRTDMSKLELKATDVANGAADQTLNVYVDGKLHKIDFRSSTSTTANATAIRNAISAAGIEGLTVSGTGTDVNLSAAGKSISVEAVLEGADNKTGLIAAGLATSISIAAGKKVSDVINEIKAFGGGNELDAKLNADGQLTVTATAAAKTLKKNYFISSAGGVSDVITGFGGKLDTVITDPSAISQRTKYAAQFDSILEQMDQLAKDAGYKGVNLLQGNDLKVIFNEDRSSLIDIKGVNASSAGLGVNSASDDWLKDSDIEKAVNEVDNAIDDLRTMASEFGNNYSVVQTREEFTENLVNVLTEGADKLTLADMNEESANMLALQTRQQLAINSLSLASQAAQSVLKLF